MRIDAYTHFFPKNSSTRCRTSPATTRTWASACARCRRCSISTSARRSSTATRTISRSCPTRSRRSRSFAKTPAQIDEIIRIINDGFAELCAKEKDHFPGWVAQISLDAPDAGVAEAERAIKKRRARRADLHQRRRQAARPAAIPAVLEEDERARQADLAASGARRRDAGLHRREEVALRDLVDVRLVLRDRRRDGAARCSPRSWTTIPNLKIITHHFGGIVPMLEGRIGPGWDVLGSRTSDEDYVALRKSLEEAPARLLQAGLLGRHRGVHRRAGDQVRA